MTSRSATVVNGPSDEFLDDTWRHTEAGWVGELELDTASALHNTLDTPIKVLVLYGSQRATSYSRLMAFEASRILSRCGADVKVFQPGSLPLKNDRDEDAPAVKSIRELSLWSDAQLWVSPEQHGAITGIMKNQIDWIPLSTGSVRPTQGRTLAVVQVNGGSQSFNTVNTLRLLGRWMRMFTIPNQSSLPQAYTQFVEGRLKPSGNRDRLVDVCEELIKTTVILRPHKALFDDRYSERTERAKHGRLQTAEEKFALLGIKAENGAKLDITKEEK